MLINKVEIKRIVIWGLKYRYHTQRHIHKAFYKNAKKIGYESVWLEDTKNNSKKIKDGDLIISTEGYGKMVPKKNTFEEYNLPIKDKVFYCLHNYQNFYTEKIKSENLIKLQVYNDVDGAKDADVKIDEARFFNTKTRTLFQPWGTDLLPEEFKKPIYNKNSFVFWIGNIWNDKENRGNLNEITELKNILKENNLKFIKIKIIPDFLHVLLIRRSRIAPAIGGNYQVKVNYLPCRMFKNISYGQLGISNIRKFTELFGDNSVRGDTIEKLINNTLSLSKQDYLSKILAQQEIVKKYTYEHAIKNIINTFKL